ncbi:MAG: DUF167 domain-containing protein [Patescibacteria group bacterium]
MKYIKVIANINSKKQNITEKSDSHFEISVKEKAERNMANKKIIEILAEYFKILPKNIRIINGHQHPHKLLVIDEK